MHKDHFIPQVTNCQKGEGSHLVANGLYLHLWCNIHLNPVEHFEHFGGELGGQDKFFSWSNFKTDDGEWALRRDLGEECTIHCGVC